MFVSHHLYLYRRECFAFPQCVRTTWSTNSLSRRLRDTKAARTCCEKWLESCVCPATFPRDYDHQPVARLKIANFCAESFWAEIVGRQQSQLFISGQHRTPLSTEDPQKQIHQDAQFDLGHQIYQMGLQAMLWQLFCGKATCE